MTTAKITTTKTCTNCRSFAYTPSDDEPTSCRLHPPTLLVIQDEVYSVWPKVLREDWCGKWFPPLD